MSLSMFTSSIASMLTQRCIHHDTPKQRSPCSIPHAIILGAVTSKEVVATKLAARFNRCHQAQSTTGAKVGGLTLKEQGLRQDACAIKLIKAAGMPAAGLSIC